MQIHFLQNTTDLLCDLGRCSSPPGSLADCPASSVFSCHTQKRLVDNCSVIIFKIQAVGSETCKTDDDDVAKFSSVKPTCGSPDCGPFRTSRPRKVPLKRKRTAKPAKSVQKQRISPWVRGPKKGTDEWSLRRLSYSLVSLICRDTKNREDTKKHTKTGISGKVYRISKVYRFARARARPRAPYVTRTQESVVHPLIYHARNVLL